MTLSLLKWLQQYQKYIFLEKNITPKFLFRKKRKEFRNIDTIT